MIEWVHKCNKLPRDGEYVLVWPPYCSEIGSDDPHHVLRWHSGGFVYYGGNFVYNAEWDDITYWASIIAPGNAQQQVEADSPEGPTA